MERLSPDKVSILLNGKQITEGQFNTNGLTVKLLDTPGIKSGWFRPDTVYERAFKQVESIIKTIKVNK